MSIINISHHVNYCDHVVKFTKTNLKQRALKLGVKAYLVKAMQTPEEVVQKLKANLS